MIVSCSPNAIEKWTANTTTRGHNLTPTPRCAFICSIWHSASIRNGGGANHDDSTTLRLSKCIKFHWLLYGVEFDYFPSRPHSQLYLMIFYGNNKRTLSKRKPSDFSTSETLTFKPVNFLFMWSWHLARSRCLCLCSSVLSFQQNENE